jgi:hypothetical protein
MEEYEFFESLCELYSDACQKPTGKSIVFIHYLFIKNKCCIFNAKKVRRKTKQNIFNLFLHSMKLSIGKIIIMVHYQ